MPDSPPHRLEFAVRECRRLTDALIEYSGTVTTRFLTRMDDTGRVLVSGVADADVVMRCQRCLEPVSVPLHAAFELAVVADDDEAGELPDGLDPLVSPDGDIDPKAMVEDELLLALPLVAMHDGTRACVPPAGGAGPEQGGRENPFAVLKRLKQDQES